MGPDLKSLHIFVHSFLPVMHNFMLIMQRLDKRILNVYYSQCKYILKGVETNAN